MLLLLNNKIQVGGINNYLNLCFGIEYKQRK